MDAYIIKFFHWNFEGVFLVFPHSLMFDFIVHYFDSSFIFELLPLTDGQDIFNYFKKHLG